MRPSVPYQPSLFGRDEPSIHDVSRAHRVHLDGAAWIDWLPSWVRGADTLFEAVQDRPWTQRMRRIYDREVVEPRLTAHWSLASGARLEPPILDGMRLALGARYGVVFDSAGFNLYRDGDDSVAWHRDTIRRDIAEPIVALVSLGAPRKLQFRPHGGGASRAFAMGSGDLLVTGGTTQRTWEHAVLKVARAGPRISIAFRHGSESRAYTADEA